MKKENASEAEPPLDDSQGSDENGAARNWLSRSSKTTRKQTIITCALIFFVALGCRLLSWHDNRFEARRVQTQVTEGYKHTARLLQAGGIRSFFSASSPLSDPNHLGHPPGYSILIAVVFSLFGESDSALQIIQILADAAAAVLVFLIALALLKNRTVATIAGLLVAIAPQFTYNSVMLLPDSLAVLPILLAVYFLIQAIKRPRLRMFIIAGALVGLSCWLRANALLLAPFMAAVIPILLERGKRLRYALALVGGTILIVAPLTIRNYIVYDYFIPVSLGAGQTMLEGIADYDTSGSLGIPNTDMGIMKWEAELYQRPDYYGMLFNPDGVKRERERLARGFAVIRSRPFWFFGVMLRRGAGMLRLERVRLISADPPVTHSLAITNETPPAWSSTPPDLLAAGKVTSTQAEAALSPDAQTLHIKGDDSKYDNQFVSAPITIEKQTDYVLRLPVRIEQGRMFVSIAGVNTDSQYASAIIEPQDWKSTDEQAWDVVEIPFVSVNAGQVQVVFANGGSKDVRPVVQVGQPQLYALGPASFMWTRVPRALVRLTQKLFVTAVMLPLAIIGLLILIIAGKRSAIALLLIVPAYYLCIQSALHTEYRYVLAIHYFLFVLVAVALYQAGVYLWRGLQKIPLMRQ
ncbi:MAG TPA: glycosyltransferase family 39 protein [Pyrinomonadaceae bacterium]|jgi:hypothetical protein|nr:glycosyltransferase family 39 protein [Pyrinomonadaceae bacterium]